MVLYILGKQLDLSAVDFGILDKDCLYFESQEPRNKDNYVNRFACDIF